ncbi:MAG: LD-carboxypeptidase [Myxococcota bacterium]|nr:LD-carboxypeptidase [Myxococcota bacterium]
MTPVVRKPRRLARGDTVAVVSPSWGGPAAFPHVLEAGLRVLREELGLRVREYPHTRAAAASPAERAADLHAAFADPDTRAVIASIGGVDSVRLLPLLDPSVFRADDKILLGYSDTTTLLTYVHVHTGLVTFLGPSVMAGLGQARALPPAFAEHVRAMLFDAPASHRYQPYAAYCEGYLPWSDPANAGQVAPLRPHPGWRWVQGRGVVRGRLFGGCADTLESVKGTRFWPEPSFWAGRVLVLETSEEAPPPRTVARWLRNYGVSGVFDVAAGLLLGRPRGYTDAQRVELADAARAIVAGEFGRTELPIVADLDFGHTDPQWILPFGCELEIDCDARTLTLLEPPTR